MKITTLCENRIEPSFGLCASHGLSLYLEFKGKTFLYDVGQDDTFIKNAKKMNIDIDNCDTIIISHGHLDHAGGLAYLNINTTNKDLIIDKRAFFKKIRYVNKQEIDIGISDILKHLEYKSTEINQSFEIFDGLWCLSQVEIDENFIGLEKGLYVIDEKKIKTEDTFSDELGLCFNTSNGLCVISGCSHRGVINIINSAKQLMNTNNIHTFIGGLHLSFATEEEIYSVTTILKKLNLKKLIIGHCTGWKAISIIEKELCPETELIYNYVGYSINL